MLKQLRKQGYDIPKLPCNIVQAKDYNEAKNLILLAVSQYGKLDKEGFLEFTENENFDFSDFDFPDFDLNFLEEEPMPEIKDLEENLDCENKCPKCGYEF